MFAPAYLFAQTIVNPAAAVSSFPQFLDMLLTIFQYIVTPILVVALIWGGFKIVTAQGDEKKIAEGKQIVLWTIVAAAIVIGAKLIYAIVRGTVQPFIDAV